MRNITLGRTLASQTASLQRRILPGAIEQGAAVSTTTGCRIDGIELFSGCRRSNVKHIDRLGTTVAVRAERALCSEGEPGFEFFVLVDGVVEVSKTTRRIARLHAGAWFGETALLHNAPRLATVMTMTDSVVVVFNRREFNTLCNSNSRVRERLGHIATLYLRGAEPTAHGWYEPSTRVRPLTTRGVGGSAPQYQLPESFLDDAL